MSILNKKSTSVFFAILLKKKNAYQKTEVLFLFGDDPQTYAKYLPTIGILRPIPNAFGETRRIGGVW